MTTPDREGTGEHRFKAPSQVQAAVEVAKRICCNPRPESGPDDEHIDSHWVIIGAYDPKRVGRSVTYRVDLHIKGTGELLAVMHVEVAGVEGSPEQWVIRSARIVQSGNLTKDLPLGPVDLDTVELD